MRSAGSFAAVERPRVLALVVGCVAALAMLAAGSWTRLHADLSGAPTVLAVNAEALEQALTEAPAAAPAGETTLWLVTTPDCRRCAALEAELTRAGAPVRVIELDGAADGPDRATLLGRLGLEELGLDGCGGLIRSACAAPTPVAASSPAYRRLEAVVAANGLQMEAPALFWRQGAEWRAVIGTDRGDVRRALKDLSLEG